jgi:hypothetical protein
LIGRYVAALGLDPARSIHSLRVAALTTARERGSDIIDLQDFAGHADSRTALNYIRKRDLLHRRPAGMMPVARRQCRPVVRLQSQAMLQPALFRARDERGDFRRR